jgi:hypothetical protein
VLAAAKAKSIGERCNGSPMLDASMVGNAN